MPWLYRNLASGWSADEVVRAVGSNTAIARTPSSARRETAAGHGPPRRSTGRVFLATSAVFQEL